MPFFMFDPIGLIIVIAGCFMGGFLPLLVLIGRCPEAKTFIKCQLGGGVIISETNAAGQREFVIAKPLGTEGQYISGKNEFGQRKIFIRPQTSSGQFNKSFILSGIRRPIFDAFTGKTILVPATILAAIEVAEKDADGKKKLPLDVQRWADDNKIGVKELEELIQEAPNPDGSDTTVKKKVTKEKTVFKKIMELDPTKLNQYFPDWFSQSQFDVLLQKAEQTGYLRGLGVRSAGAGGKPKWAIVGIFIFIMIMVIGIVGLLASGAI